METQAPATNAMLAKLGVVFGPPDSPDPKAFLAAYARLMVKYGPTELEAAADKLIATRKFKSWPTVAECIGALEDHRAELFRQNSPDRNKAPPHPDWTKEAFEIADNLCRCDMGRKAVREGWFLALHDHCRKERKLPSPYRIGELIEAAKFVDQCAAGCVDMGAAHAALLKLAHSIIAKREKRIKRVFGTEFDGTAPTQL